MPGIVLHPTDRRTPLLHFAKPSQFVVERDAVAVWRGPLFVFLDHLKQHTGQSVRPDHALAGWFARLPDGDFRDMMPLVSTGAGSLHMFSLDDTFWFARLSSRASLRQNNRTGPEPPTGSLGVGPSRHSPASQPAKGQPQQRHSTPWQRWYSPWQLRSCTFTYFYCCC